MSVLIKGMDMPKDECGFLMAFTLNEKGEWLCAKMNECKWRTVNVLPPHGRLIDASQFEVFGYDVVEGSFDDGVTFVLNKIDDAPTVIEGEE